MSAPPRFTRRLPAQMTETGYRRLRAFAAENGMSEPEAMSFIFENLTGLMDEAALAHRLHIFKMRLEKQA